MTLKQWSKQYNQRPMFRLGAVWVPQQDVVDQALRDLHNLTDYLVSSVTDGTIWLVRRRMRRAA